MREGVPCRRMPDSWLSRQRQRIKRNRVVSVLVAGLTTLGVLVRWLKDLLDWVSRWDTLNLHAQASLKTAAIAVAQVPPGISEACYAVAVIVILVAASRKRGEQPDSVVVAPQ